MQQVDLQNVFIEKYITTRKQYTNGGKKIEVKREEVTLAWLALVHMAQKEVTHGSGPEN